jgi:hypothetical protein
MGVVRVGRVVAVVEADGVGVGVVEGVWEEVRAAMAAVAMAAGVVGVMGVYNCSTAAGSPACTGYTRLSVRGWAAGDIQPRR